MNILLITNSLQPAAAEYFGGKRGVRGGWVYSSAKRIASIQNYNVCIASIHEHGDKFLKFEKDSILYYIVPTKSRNVYDKNLETFWKTIASEFNPDVTHIYGTEFPLSLSFVNACGNNGVIVSIQGMVSMYEPYYFGGLLFKDLLPNTSIKEILLKSTIFNTKKHFKKRGEYEFELLRQVKYIEGRTSWDKENCWAINPNLKYFECHRTLRDEFYKHKWNPDMIERHSIFLSQGRSPLKGMHIALKAMAIVKKHYPDVKMYVTNDINMDSPVIHRVWDGRCYDNYLRKLIKSLDLTNNVVFTNYLDEKEMCMRYLHSNVFVCPSSIENSPNSVGEAQILGVPCIASYVGGTMDMVKDGETGFLYRFEESNMLAYKIYHLFRMSKEEILELSLNERNAASKRHSVEENTRRMINIYNEVYAEERNKQ